MTVVKKQLYFLIFSLFLIASLFGCTMADEQSSTPLPSTPITSVEIELTATISSTQTLYPILETTPTLSPTPTETPSYTPTAISTNTPNTITLPFLLVALSDSHNIWIIDSETLSTSHYQLDSPEGLIGNIEWSMNDLSLLYFSHFLNGQQNISELDFNTMMVENVVNDFIDKGFYFKDLSSDWLRIAYVGPRFEDDSNFVTLGFLAVNLKSGEIRDIDSVDPLNTEEQFAWSPVSPNQYIRLDYECENNQGCLVIENLEQQELHQNIELFYPQKLSSFYEEADIETFAWHPHKPSLIVLFDGEGANAGIDYLSMVNIDTGRTELLQEFIDLSFNTVEISPNGEWLVLENKATERSLTISLSKPAQLPKEVYQVLQSPHYFVGWDPNTERPIFEAAGALWLVDPTLMSLPLQLLDLKQFDFYQDTNYLKVKVIR